MYNKCVIKTYRKFTETGFSTITKLTFMWFLIAFHSTISILIPCLKLSKSCYLQYNYHLHLEGYTIQIQVRWLMKEPMLFLNIFFLNTPNSIKTDFTQNKTKNHFKVTYCLDQLFQTTAHATTGYIYVNMGNVIN